MFYLFFFSFNKHPPGVYNVPGKFCYFTDVSSSRLNRDATQSTAPLPTAAAGRLRCFDNDFKSHCSERTSVVVLIFMSLGYMVRRGISRSNSMGITRLVTHLYYKPPQGGQTSLLFSPTIGEQAPLLTECFH